MKKRRYLFYTVMALCMVFMVTVFAGCMKTMDDLYKSNDIPEAERLEILHKDLKKLGGNHHDAFLMIGGIGNETSVPIILKALKPYLTPGPQVCTAGHGLEALEMITNHTPGKDYGDWEKWWEIHKGEDREKWVLDGFRIAGLPVASPPDKEFVSALVRTLASEEEHLCFNARKCLDEAPRDLVEACVTACSASDDEQDRLGSVAWLGETELVSMGLEEHDPATEDDAEILRELAADANAKVRESALAKLNSHLRAATMASGDDLVIWKKTIGSHITVVAAGLDESHLLIGLEAKPRMGTKSQLLNFDINSKEADWVFACPSVVNSVPVLSGNSIFFCCDDGAVLCVNASTGKELWRQKTEGHPCYRPMNKILLIENMAITTMRQYLWAFDRETGKICWKLDLHPSQKDSPSQVGCFDYASGHIFVPSFENKILKVTPKGSVVAEYTAESKYSYRIKAYGDRILATIREGSEVYYCAFTHDLELLWKTEVEEMTTGGGSCVINNKIIVGMGMSTMALDITTGECLWKEPENFQDKEPTGIIGDNFLTIGSRFRLELRAAENGEVRCTYPVEPFPSTRAHVTSDLIAIPDMDGMLWLLKIPEGV
ncbi:MAG: PQQ-binding-like beta-propeller repeat protein [Candidatus Hydrogenedentes bacterium]|nr:PQQ-binding-like beta-propeller repeat protein [Candidatus Hydrogenedentota bacterium]